MIVDDHPVVRAGLASMIRNQPGMEVIAEAKNGHEAIELYRALRPRVTLMDLSLPDLTGVEVIKRIRMEFADAKFIVLSVYSGNEDIHACLEAGALAYLLKDSEPEVLVQAIRETSAGRRYVPPAIALLLAERIAMDTLTPRELEVIRLMSQGMSNREIAEGLQLSETTVKTHVANILDKLRVESRSHAIVEALRRGIVHGP